MRMAIGLAGILVTIGVIVWIMSAITLPATKNALDVKKRVTPQVEQIAGHTTDGTRAADTIHVKAQHSGSGRMTGVVVTEVIEGAAMDKYFGLKKDDVIVEIGPLPVSDRSDAADAKDFLVAEYQHSGTITVVRDGNKIKLPLSAAAKAAAAPAAAPTAAPAAGSSGGGGGSSSSDPLQKQLDAIQSVPR